MLFKKEKSMKLSRYFELVKPKYTYIKVVPDKSIRNYNNINIAKAISNTYRTIGKRLHKKKKKLFFETNFKLDRISLLKEKFNLEYMFNKGAKGNINIAEELEKGKVIIVKMLQDEFSQHAKNVITTFFVNKIWLSTEIRGKWNNKLKRTYITIDELFQTPTAIELLAQKNVLPQTKKVWM